MKRALYLVITCAAMGVLILAGAHVLSNPDLQGPDEMPPEIPGNRTTGPADGPREITPFIVLHRAGGRSSFLYPEDPGYPAIEAECCEQIWGIYAQYKMGFSREDLDAMKQNGTYVAMNFPVPTTFETSYVIDASPKKITVNEAIFFLDLEAYPETMIIARAENGTGVWDTSRDRGELRDLVAPILWEVKN